MTYKLVPVRILAVAAAAVGICLDVAAHLGKCTCVALASLARRSVECCNFVAVTLDRLIVHEQPQKAL